MVAFAQTMRSRTAVSLLLIAPLFVFLLVFYAYPITSFLLRGISTSDISDTIPATSAELARWDGFGLPAPEVYATLVQDLGASAQSAAILGRRLNAIEPGMRSTVRKATSVARKLDAASPEEAKSALIQADPLWGRSPVWQLLKRETALVTSTFLLAAIDVRRDGEALSFQSDEESVFLPIYGRTLVISLAVTLSCIVIGYPVAWVIAMARPRRAAWLMLLVLVPFWLSILARTAAWIIVLQGNGPINSALIWLGLAETPLQLIYNRFGVILVMVHVMLPFLVLPLCNAIRAIPKSYFQAAANLGASPLRTFFHVIFPLTVPGIWAGGFIVFILSIGYYITPALVGGPSDQMISSFIAFYTNQSVNWSLAAALSAWLLAGMLVLVMFGQRIVGPMIKRAT